jgi:hypothetical protein
MASEKGKQALRGVGTDGLIHGKVASLLNASTVVLNVGSRQGVTEGMEFDILNRNAGTITDPDTHEELGSLTLAKLRVSVNAVFPQLAAARIKGGGAGRGLFAPWLSLGGGTSLRRTEHEDIEEIAEKDSIVKIGDEVVQVPVSTTKGSG